MRKEGEGDVGKVEEMECGRVGMVEKVEIKMGGLKKVRLGKDVEGVMNGMEEWRVYGV